MATYRHNNINSSSITITEYTMPSPLDWFAIGCMLALFGTGVASPWITPGDQIWNLLTQYFPGGPEWVVWIGQTLVPLLALAHVAEVAMFDHLRMRRHGVRRWSRVWWMWEISCAVEGIRAWKRIDRMIAHKMEKQSKA
ncbi:hypothetical protein VF21_01364 [Pseudogymnoascus sp. 05NY08]|nr:hypothetical protein VF21_01364 [Pseudogymnoascus sp. 05NY08]